MKPYLERVRDMYIPKGMMWRFYNFLLKKTKTNKYKPKKKNGKEDL